MSAGVEQFIVIWYAEDGSGDVFAATMTGGNVIKRSIDAVKPSVHGVLSTEEEISEARPGVRYAVPVELARSYFGWDV